MTTDIGMLSTETLVPVVELELVGDLDIDATLALSEQLDDAMRLGPRRLVVRLSRCCHVDAQAIRVLLDAHSAMWDKGGRLVLAGCSDPAKRLLEMAGVLAVFELDDELSA